MNAQNLPPARSATKTGNTLPPDKSSTKSAHNFPADGSEPKDAQNVEPDGSSLKIAQDLEPDISAWKSAENAPADNGSKINGADLPPDRSSRGCCRKALCCRKKTAAHLPLKKSSRGCCKRALCCSKNNAADLPPERSSRGCCKRALCCRKKTAAHLPPDRSSRGCYKRALCELWLLVWKNLLLRKSHVCITCCEMSCAPIYVAIIIVPLHLATLGTGSTGRGTAGDGRLSAFAFENNPVPQKIGEFFPTAKFTFKSLEWKLIDELTREILGTEVAYAPSNSRTQPVIQMLSSQLPRGNIQWSGYESERRIEDAALRGKKIRVAIVFEDGFAGDGGVVKPVGGSEISYKLRHEAEETGSRSHLHPALFPPSPMFASKLLGLEILLDKIIIAQLANQNQLSNDTISVQQFEPQRAGSGKARRIGSLKSGWRKGEGREDGSPDLGATVVIMLMICFCTIVPGVMREVVDEKASGVKELMRMMGLGSWMHWTAWMIDSLLTLLLPISVIVLLCNVSYYAPGIPQPLYFKFVDSSLYWFLLFSYAVAGSSFAFFVSTFFQRPMYAIATGIALWILTSILPLAFDPDYAEMSFVTKFSICLVPNFALFFADRIIDSYTYVALVPGKKIPTATWGDFYSGIDPDDQLTLGLITAAMYLSTALYCILAVYVENILPSEFGVRKPFYYPFMPSTWCHGKVGPEKPDSENMQKTDGGGNFEKDPTEIEKGVEIKNLRKVFGFGKLKKVAVADLTMNMYHGQITALLGHNGAGKTTAMSMLTGMTAPTSGTAIINGYDINRNMAAVRQNLGFCPQQNMLFNTLTVEQHLKFFGRLKRSSMSHSLLDEMEEMFEMLDFQLQVYTPSTKLSGGQKRKLQLAIALIGRSEVVILDEPTSGLDPEARRIIWNLLHDLRKDRTIMLTTHYMEEADVLADRIGIMSDGHLECCGSSMFLKLRYGAGYTLQLMMELEPAGKPSAVLETVRKHVDNAEVKSESTGTSGLEMAITLPTQTEVRVASKFPQMFSELEQEKSNLGIKNMSLGFTTMDDVFVKVDELHYKKKGSDVGVGGDKKEGVDEGGTYESLLGRRRTGLGLVCCQFCALLAKMAEYKRRKWGQTLFQIFVVILPFLVILMFAKIGEKQSSGRRLRSSRQNFLQDFNDPLVLYSSNDHKIEELFSDVVGGSAKLEKVGGGGGMARAAGGKEGGNKDYVVGVEMTKGTDSALHINAMYSGDYEGAASMGVKLATNTLLRRALPLQKVSIRMRYAELASKSRQGEGISAAEVLSVLFAILFPIGVFIQGGSFIVPPVEERLNQGKQLELMTGVGMFSYWFSFFIFDFATLILVSAFMTGVFAVVALDGFLIDWNSVATLFLILMCFGFSAIWLSYLASQFHSVGSGFGRITIFYIFTGFVIFLVIALDVSTWVFGLTLVYDFSVRFLPPFDVVCSIYLFMSTMRQNWEYKSNCKLTQSFPCPYRSYVTWSLKNNLRIFNIGIGQMCLWMVIVGLFYMSLLFLIESRIFSALAAHSGNRNVVQERREDKDVTAEKLRAEQMMKSGKMFEDALLAFNLRKSFKSIIAVSNITFGVHPGECFGLLGTNGAGKTTTFRMLTGDLSPSSGDAFLSFNRSRLVENRSRFLSALGYCPQFDGIIGVLTGRQMLLLFARLRGVPSNKIREHANKLLCQAGLENSGNVECRHYSGGMKRQLTTAMALAGDPPVILLDEPTAGVDPVARRHFWKIIGKARASGKSVILTSHSMEECEAVCSRLGMMVDGKMQCIGTVNYLKKKFAQGYNFQIRLSIMLPSSADQNAPDPPEVAQLLNAVSQLFSPCLLRDKHQNLIEFHLLNTLLSLKDLFGKAEEIKVRFGDLIADYSVSETTLEDVFIQFARRS